MGSRGRYRRPLRVFVDFLGGVRAGGIESQSLRRPTHGQSRVRARVSVNLVSVAEFDVHDLWPGTAARVAVDSPWAAAAFEPGKVRAGIDLRGIGIRLDHPGGKDGTGTGSARESVVARRSVLPAYDRRAVPEPRRPLDCDETRAAAHRGRHDGRLVSLHCDGQ